MTSPEVTTPSDVRRSDGIGAAAAVLTVGMLLGKLAVFAQESAVASMFGASSSVDAIVTARLIPSFVAGSLGAAVAIALIPVFQHLHQQGQERLLRGVLRLAVLSVLLTMGVILFASFSFSDLVLRAIAPGYSPAQQALAFRLMVAAFALSFLDTCGLLLISLLQAEGRFRSGALVSVVAALVGVGAVIILGTRIGIWGVMVGWGVGSALQLSLLSYLTRSVCMGLGSGFSDAWHQIARLGRLALPVVCLTLVANVVTFTDRSIASQLGSGSVAIINWAQKVYNLPLGLVVVPLATAVYPFFTKTTGRRLDSHSRLRMHLSVAATLFLVMPASILLVLLRDQVATILFMRGAFSEADVGRLGDVLAGYGVGLAFIGSFAVLVRISYGLGSTWSPVLAAALGSALYVPVAIALSHGLGLAGLALAYSLVMFVSCGTLLADMWLKHREALFGLWGPELLKIAVASTGMWIAIVCTRALLVSGIALQAPPAWTLGVFVTIGLACYWGLSVLMGSDVQRRMLVEVRRGFPLLRASRV